MDSALLRRIVAEAETLARGIRDAAERSRGREPQFGMRCDVLLADFCRRAGLRWEPEGERRVVWLEEESSRYGWIDRLFNRVVVEYKPPESLRARNDASGNRKGLKQVRDYMDGLITKEGWKQASVAGVVTDGFWFVFCRYSVGRWVEEAPVETSPVSVARFLRLLLTFHRPPLLPDPLVERFGASGDVMRAVVKALYDALGDEAHELTRAVYLQWQDYFADIAGLDPDALQEKKELVEFARGVLQKRTADPARLLFALYTYSALLTKLLAVAAVTPFFDTENMERLADWAMLDDSALLAALSEVESGRFFQERGIVNFVEGNFFGWYCLEWNAPVASAVNGLLRELSEFDPDAVEQAPERVRDLLKSLYHGLFPREVRHALGEYYTPDWLAERLLAQLDADLFAELPKGTEARRRAAERVARRLTETSFIDPACGSGTFLVLIIRRLRQWAREAGVSEKDRLLPALLENLVGFDLNPLAVICSRANFLLAVADLLTDRRDPVRLPVYLADSIVLPAEAQENELFAKQATYELPLRGVRKKFLVPRALAKRESLDRLAQLLRRDVGHVPPVPVHAFLDSCEGEFGLSAGEWGMCRPVLTELYETLVELHQANRNGLWADIARNMFMPLFVGKADFVVGNPPWVNWQTLPKEYRDRSKRVWDHYGLFVHKGMDVILGKGKKELSTLLVYVAAHLYLKPGGKLGFVIDRRVFKTSGAAQGFRRFQIGDGTKLRVLAVDDFSAFQPFEGATNQTGALVLQKGQETKYPVRYNVWRKRTRTSVPFNAILEEAAPLLVHRQFSAEPVDPHDQTSAWLTAPGRLLPVIRKVLGASDYRAYAGAYSGGANAVYWLRLLERHGQTVTVENITERQKREVKRERHVIEADLLYPLLRGREVARWHVAPDNDAFFLIVQDAKTRKGLRVEALANDAPRTLAYLERHKALLTARKAFRRYFRQEQPFYSMFNIGEYTFAPYKVVWAEQGEFGCAVVGEVAGKPLVPDHKIMLVPFEDPAEAHYVCAVANSVPFVLAVKSYAVDIQQDTHVFANVKVPRYDAGNANHRDLANLSMTAHQIASGERGGVLADVEREVNDRAARVWGLTERDLAAVQAELAHLQVVGRRVKAPRLMPETL